jgi:hypothetical protein
MNKKPHIAFTPQEELTAPMPLPVSEGVPTSFPQATPIPQSALVETVRVTPQTMDAARPICPRCQRKLAKSFDDAASGFCPREWAPRDKEAERDCDKHAGMTKSLSVKSPKQYEEEEIPGVKKGMITPRGMKITPARKRPSTPYGPVLDATATRVSGELHSDESVIVEPIDDEVSSGAPLAIDDTLDGSGDRTSAVAMVDLPNEMKATILFWLVNLAREQGLGLSKTRHKQAIELERIMEMDPVYHDYSMDEMLKEHRGTEPQQISVKTRGGKKTKLHTVEMSINDWPRFEQWMKIQAENNFRDMTMLDMLDAEIRVASWEYLTRFSHMVREKLSHGYAMFRDNQPVPLLDLLHI